MSVDVVIERTLPSSLRAAVEEAHTQPIYLVRVEWPSGASHMSSGPQTSFGGSTYLADAVRVGTFTWDNSGGQSGSIYLSNENNVASAIVLNTRIEDTPVTIWQTYAGTNVEPELIVNGVLESPDSIGMNEVGIRVSTSGSGTRLVPSTYHTKGRGFNHLPRPGTVIHWAGEKFELQAEGS